MHRVYKLDGIGDDQGKWADPFTGMSVDLRVLDGSADITAHCVDASGLVVGTTPITRDVLTSLPNLTIVTRTGVGVDSIDVAAATELGIQVTNVPDANHHEVATHALALILGGVRRIKAFDTSVREHRWVGTVVGQGMRRPTELTLGILGFGRTGRQLAAMAAPIGFRTIAHASRATTSTDATRMVSFEELIDTADIISVHLPLTAETKNLLSRDVLAKCKPGAYVVNVARGGIVDEDALAALTVDGHLAGGALDVFSTEPLEPASPLRGVPAITLTPHVAYLSSDSADEVVAKGLADVARALRGEPVKYPVNMPEQR